MSAYESGTILAIVLGACAAVSGCASSDDGGPAPSADVPFEVVSEHDVVLVSAADWPDAIRSPDVRVRAAGADALMTAPRDVGAAALDELIHGDPEPHVRERAVLSLARLLGRDAIPALEEVATSEEHEDVIASAMASLSRLRLESVEPARGWMELVVAQDVVQNRPFDVVVQFGADVDVPRAKLFLELPEGVEQVAPEAKRWSGALHASREEEVRFTLRVTGEPPRILASARLAISHSRFHGEVVERSVELPHVSSGERSP